MVGNLFHPATKVVSLLTVMVSSGRSISPSPLTFQPPKYSSSNGTKIQTGSEYSLPVSSSSELIVPPLLSASNDKVIDSEGVGGVGGTGISKVETFSE